MHANVCVCVCGDVATTLRMFFKYKIVVAGGGVQAGKAVIVVVEEG